MKSSEEMKAKAKEMWEEMDDNEKFGVRVGLFPAEIMRRAEAEGFTKMAVPLMEIASAQGGMRA